MNDAREILAQEGIVYLSLKAIPNAQKTIISEVLVGEETVLKLRVAAVPEKGKANKEIEEFIGKEFNAVAEIVGGQTSQLKLVKIVL